MLHVDASAASHGPGGGLTVTFNHAGASIELSMVWPACQVAGRPVWWGACFRRVRPQDQQIVLGLALAAARTILERRW